MMKKIISLLVLLLSSILVFSDANKRMPVKTEKAEIHTLVQTFRTFGTIQADSSTDINISSQYDGIITAIFYRIGDKVEKNAILATFKTKEAQALEGVDNYQINEKNIVSPISGYIVAESIFTGAEIMKGQPIIRIVSNTRKFISISIPNRFKPYIKKGTKISVNSDIDKFQTVLEKIIPITNPKNNTFEAIAFIQNKNLFIGSVCEVIVVMEEKKVLSVKRDAILTTKDGEKTLFVAESGKAIRKEVQIGIQTDNFIEIKSGITRGNEVIVLGNYELEDGMKIRILNQ